MSFKKFLVEQGIIDAKLINERFESDFLKRVIDAAKVSRVLEGEKEASVEGRTKDGAIYNYPSGKNAFLKLNKTLYQAMGLPALEKIPSEAFTEITPEEARKRIYTAPQYVKFYMNDGSTSLSGAENLIGITKGNEILYGGSYDDGRFDSPESAYKYPGSIPTRLDKEYTINRYYSGRDRRRRSDTQKIPGTNVSNRSLGEMSTSVIVLDVNKAKELLGDSYSAVPTRVKRKESREGATKLMSDHSIRSLNFEKYNKLAAKKLLPSEFEESVDNCFESILNLQREVKNSGAMRDSSRFRYFTTELTELTRDYYSMLNSYLYEKDKIQNTAGSRSRYSSSRAFIPTQRLSGQKTAKGIEKWENIVKSGNAAEDAFKSLGYIKERIDLIQKRINDIRSKILGR